MKRASRVRDEALDIIEEGNRPSAEAIARRVEMSSADVHRCLNFLEKKGKVETYRKEVMGVEHRLVGVNR